MNESDADLKKLNLILTCLNCSFDADDTLSEYKSTLVSTLMASDAFKSVSLLSLIPRRSISGEKVNFIITVKPDLIAVV